MNELQTFTYNKSPVRTVEINNEPWFVLKDVCDILELGSPHKVAERLDEDEKGRNLIPTLGGKQEMTVISESGLYNVILRSDKPEAKPFRKWVTSEVLPSIRKTGSYSVSKPDKALETGEYHYFQKTLNGEPVITLADFEHFTGITSGSARHALYNIGKDGADYKLLTQSELAVFKTENPSVTKAANALIIIKKSGVDKLIKHFGSKADIPQMIESKPLPAVEIVEIPRYKTVTTEDCIVALNVLQYIKNRDKKIRADSRNSGEMGMFEYYDKDIAAIERTMKEIGTLILAGC